ncbi:MAG: hypothetical protein H0T79_09750 [Deltaproteobacteria bacterium]|nr:hypothetical protein [Deltaproteobacteria bacterium]
MTHLKPSYRAVLTNTLEASESLIRLWTENLPIHGDPEAKLRWFYQDAPAGKGEAFILHEPTSDQPVGCAGISTREVVFRGAVSRAALLADFAIDRQHRSALPALVLSRSVKQHIDATYNLSYGLPNNSAVAVFKRTGYHELGRMARFVRVLRHASFLERRFGGRRRSALAGTIVDRAMLVTSVARGLSTRARYALRWASDFDSRWDRLWERASPNYPILCRRSSAFLRWRFLRKPNERNAIAALIDRFTGIIAAYAIVRGERDQPAELVDLFGITPHEIDVLLDHLVPALYARGHTTVEFRYLGHPRMLEVLARHLFTLRTADRVVVVSPGAACAIDHAVLADASSWYMTDLDEDT